MRLSEKLAALLVVAALLPLALISILLLYATSTDAEARASRQLQTDARVAATIYEKRLAEMRGAASLLANDIANRAFVNAASAEGGSAVSKRLVQDILAAAQNELSMDFLVVTDPQGRVFARHNNEPEPGETLIEASDKNPVAERVITEGAQLRGSPVAAPVVERGQRLVRFGLDKRARVGDIGDALTLEAAAPIFGAGRFLGVVLIGQMLNNSHGAPPNASSLQLPLEAEVRQTLFRSTASDNRAASEPGGAVIALGNTIITSSVPQSGSADTGALLGASCDPSRAEQTVEHNDSGYIIAWQPMKSLDQSPIAAIGVALPQNSIGGPASGARTTVILVAAVVLAVAAAVGFLYGRSLSERLKTLSAAAGRMGLGELSTPVKDPAPTGLLSRDEINGLAEEMDQMRDSFRQAIDRLRKR
jgi:HAMP domain-containing protein